MASSKVDRETKIIHGYSVMSLGEAKGHGFSIDETTLDQLVAIGNSAEGGLKTRVRHPGQGDDRFGGYLGQSRNFRREGDRVLADMHLSNAAFVSPEGDLGTYVMARADEGGSGFGASPEIKYTLDRTKKGVLPAARLKSVPAIAIVDDPATNTAFFSCLSVGDDDMADTAQLEAQNAELSAERDLLAGEVSRLKADNAKLQSDVTAKAAELSVAKVEATSKAIADERSRIADVLALCGKAGKADLSAKYIADGVTTADVQSQLFAVLCSGNKPIGEGDGDKGLTVDQDAALKAEYSSDPMLSLSGITEADYLTSRRISEGREQLLVRK
jgi:hypothetical protein